MIYKIYFGNRYTVEVRSLEVLEMYLSEYRVVRVEHIQACSGRVVHVEKFSEVA